MFHNDKEHVGIKSSTLRSLFGFKDKVSLSSTIVAKLKEGSNNNDTSAEEHCSQFTSTITKTVHIRVPLLDVFQEPKFHDYHWKLKLLPQWQTYLLIYVCLTNGDSLITQLYQDIKEFIDYYQKLDEVAILIHSSNQSFHYSMLKYCSPIFVINMVISNSKWLYLINNYMMTSVFKEMNLQMVKYYNFGFPRVVLSVFGIPALVNKQELISFFEKLGKLISIKFAPIGKLTKFHVISLQFSRFLNFTVIKSQILKFKSAYLSSKQALTLTKKQKKTSDLVL